jgi:transposase
MTENRNIPLGFVGCDVAKDSIVVHHTGDARARMVRNQRTDLAAFAKRLDPTCLVICEATGGYEAELLAAMLEAGIPVHRADARRVKAFIRSLGRLAKTDRIDAAALARYGQERHAGLARWQAHETTRDQLHALVHVRQDMVATHTAYSNRRIAPGSQPAEGYLDAVMQTLQAQIKAIDNDIKALIRGHEKLRQAVKILCSIKGIGAITAANLLALMPELGTLSRRQIASLAGLAPHPNQSGNTDKYRYVKGGRHDVKSALFMAALSASRHHATLRVFYQRLLAKGKLKLVALTAVMRKLLIICNARLRAAAAAA